jgi:hypothetical protein
MAFGISEYSESLLPRSEGRVWGHFSLSLSGPAYPESGPSLIPLVDSYAHLPVTKLSSPRLALLI